MKKVKQYERKVVNLWAKMKEKSQKRLFLGLGLLFLLALFISFSVPVYYVPLFNNISSRFGLPSDVSRKLTLLDLALSSLGIETQNMTEAFKKQKIVDETNPFYTAYYELPAGSRLINAKETYYHEFERTRRRPTEVAGVYQDGKSAKTPEIGDTVKGVRALPDSSSLTSADIDGVDDGYTDFSYKRATARTNSKDEILGNSKRQVRGAYDNEGTTVGNQSRPKHEDLPDFASTIYNPATGQNETLTLSNSRMMKPLVIGEPFTVAKSENVITRLVGDSSFTDSFSFLGNFGGAKGSLGYYVKDDWDKVNPFNFFGSSGEDMFLSYFYSYAAIGRKYLESSKHLSEIAFHGDDPQDQVLIARGQKENKIPTVDLGTPPLVLMITVKNNLAECDAARRVYEQTIPRLIHDYEEAKNTIIGISSGTVAVPGYPNYAWRGAPGACECDIMNCEPTEKLRELWNDNVEIAREKCKEIREAGEVYANACKMEYKLDDENEDTCENIGVLKVDGGERWFNLSAFFSEDEVSVCRVNVNWNNQVTAHSFQRCGIELGLDNCERLKLSAELLPGDYIYDGCQSQREKESREDCVGKIDNLFDKIDQNVKLDSQPGFMFN